MINFNFPYKSQNVQQFLEICHVIQQFEILPFNDLDIQVSIFTFVFFGSRLLYELFINLKCKNSLKFFYQYKVLYIYITGTGNNQLKSCWNSLTYCVNEIDIAEIKSIKSNCTYKQEISQTSFSRIQLISIYKTQKQMYFSLFAI